MNCVASDPPTCISYEAELSKTLIATIAAASKFPRHTLLQKIPRLMKLFSEKQFQIGNNFFQTFSGESKCFFSNLISLLPEDLSAEQKELKVALANQPLEIDRYVFRLADPSTNQCKLPAVINFDLDPSLWYIGMSPVPFFEASLVALLTLENLTQ